MKKLTLIFIFPIILFSTIQFSFAQCIPLDSLACPDPEGNGEICPDTLAPVVIGVDYNQQVTMIAPSSIDTMGFTADLHHITLISVEGLPEGISWQTNAEGDEFLTGIYYCIQFSGTTQDEPGDYPLKIVVDIYAEFFGEVIKLTQLADSTSLSMEVIQNPSSIGDNPKENLFTNVWPNPFADFLNIQIADELTGNIDVELYNLLGERIFQNSYYLNSNRKTISIKGDMLPEGIYFVSLNYQNRRYSRLVSKIR